MGYCDHTAAELRQLTRQKRAARAQEYALQARQERYAAFVRASAEATYEYAPVDPGYGHGRDNRKSMTRQRLWFWAIGARKCYYCDCTLTRATNLPNTLTVDHKHPLSLGGSNLRHNLAPCCLTCNGAKGSTTEAEFRALRAAAGF